MFQSDGENRFESDLYQNVPNMSMMFMMYTPTFGNGNFMIQPPGPGEVQPGFPSVPYMPLEALFYQQMSSNPFTATNLASGGQSVGQQNIAGTQTAYDSEGTSRYQLGVS